MPHRWERSIICCFYILWHSAENCRGTSQGHACWHRLCGAPLAPQLSCQPTQSSDPRLPCTRDVLRSRPDLALRGPGGRCHCPGLMPCSPLAPDDAPPRRQPLVQRLADQRKLVLPLGVDVRLPRVALVALEFGRPVMWGSGHQGAAFLFCITDRRPEAGGGQVSWEMP